MNIVPFSFESHSIRVVQNESGEPVVVAKDLAEALQYPESSLSNMSRLVQHVPEEWKGRNPVPTPGGVQEMHVLTEQGVYFFLARSDKPKALAMQKWLAGEVLPSLRKTGSYSVPSASPSKPGRVLPPVASEFRAALSIAKLSGLKGNQAILAAAQATRKLTGTDCLALVGATHLVAENQNRALTPTELGQILGGLSAMKVNALLVERGMQVKAGTGQWAPTYEGKAFAVLLDTGKKHGNGTPVQQLKWTEDVISRLRGSVQ